MSDQGKANYDGYRRYFADEADMTLDVYDELGARERAAFDAGADAVEAWLAEAPVDEDAPGNEPAKVIIVERDGHPARRFQASGWEVLEGDSERGDLALTDEDGATIAQISARLWDAVYGASVAIDAETEA
jgi:hypothetical protein